MCQPDSVLWLFLYTHICNCWQALPALMATLSGMCASGLRTMTVMIIDVLQQSCWCTYLLTWTLPAGWPSGAQGAEVLRLQMLRAFAGLR